MSCWGSAPRPLICHPCSIRSKINFSFKQSMSLLPPDVGLFLLWLPFFLPSFHPYRCHLISLILSPFIPLFSLPLSFLFPLFLSLSSPSLSPLFLIFLLILPLSSLVFPSVVPSSLLLFLPYSSHLFSSLGYIHQAFDSPSSLINAQEARRIWSIS